MVITYHPLGWSLYSSKHKIKTNIQPYIDQLFFAKVKSKLTQKD